MPDLTLDVEFRVRSNGDKIAILPATQLEVMVKQVQDLEAEKEQLRLSVDNLKEQLQMRQAHTDGLMKLKAGADRAAGKAEEEVAIYLTRLQKAHNDLKRYGWHRPSCPYNGSIGNSCDCGFAEVMGGIEERSSGIAPQSN